MPDSYARTIQRLTESGSIRVWSLLVTIFGDLAPDQPLDGPTLSLIMAQIGIKPEATRVALHRLRSDGWITSQKNGRISQHSLTEKGQRDSAAAQPRIYGRPSDMSSTALLIMTQTARADLDPTQFVQVSDRVFLCNNSTPMPADAMQLTPTGLPDWLGPQHESPDLREGYRVLHHALHDIDLDGPSLAPLDIAVLRVMVVHAWRRLTLKHADLPRTAHSANWHGHDCRARVTEVLDRFARPALDAIKAP
ncbi:PaaX family transcriptional regulator [uncultured Tateyamaria sp.]|uniref:PaaX family transcriptional regulator n=1 Tax=uncultured Tateyamaria sp. TaxID=455651 RepID=UPI002632D0F0|nr:PaaX family transcriptional regulator [uncultured Tateyamaria sp.]